jgi:hypothetical protein
MDGYGVELRQVPKVYADTVGVAVLDEPGSSKPITEAYTD